jgi:hypothetical protein
MLLPAHAVEISGCTDGVFTEPVTVAPSGTGIAIAIDNCVFERGLRITAALGPADSFTMVRSMVHHELAFLAAVTGATISLSGVRYVETTSTTATAPATFAAFAAAVSGGANVSMHNCTATCVNNCTLNALTFANGSTDTAVSLAGSNFRVSGSWELVSFSGGHTANITVRISRVSLTLHDMGIKTGPTDFMVCYVRATGNVVGVEGVTFDLEDNHFASTGSRHGDGEHKSDIKFVSVDGPVSRLSTRVAGCNISISDMHRAYFAVLVANSVRNYTLDIYRSNFVFAATHARIASNENITDASIRLRDVNAQLVAQKIAAVIHADFSVRATMSCLRCNVSAVATDIAPTVRSTAAFFSLRHRSRDVVGTVRHSAVFLRGRIVTFLGSGNADGDAYDNMALRLEHSSVKCIASNPQDNPFGVSTGANVLGCGVGVNVTTTILSSTIHIQGSGLTGVAVASATIFAGHTGVVADSTISVVTKNTFMVGVISVLDNSAVSRDMSRFLRNTTVAIDSQYPFATASILGGGNIADSADVVADCTIRMSGAAMMTNLASVLSSLNSTLTVQRTSVSASVAAGDLTLMSVTGGTRHTASISGVSISAVATAGDAFVCGGFNLTESHFDISNSSIAAFASKSMSAGSFIDAGKYSSALASSSMSLHNVAFESLPGLVASGVAFATIGVAKAPAMNATLRAWNSTARIISSGTVNAFSLVAPAGSRGATLAVEGCQATVTTAGAAVVATLYTGSADEGMNMAIADSVFRTTSPAAFGLAARFGASSALSIARTSSKGFKYMGYAVRPPRSTVLVACVSVDGGLSAAAVRAYFPSTIVLPCSSSASVTRSTTAALTATPLIDPRALLTPSSTLSASVSREQRNATSTVARTATATVEAVEGACSFTRITATPSAISAADVRAGGTTVTFRTAGGTGRFSGVELARATWALASPSETDGFAKRGAALRSSEFKFSPANGSVSVLLGAAPRFDLVDSGETLTVTFPATAFSCERPGVVSADLRLTVDAVENAALAAAREMATVASAVTVAVVAGSAPAAADMQAALVVGLISCGASSSKSTAKQSRFLLAPLGFGDAQLSVATNLGLLALFVGAQLLAAAVLHFAKRQPWREATSRVRFPTLAFSAAGAQLQGTAFYSYAMLLRGDVNAAAILGAAVAVALPLAVRAAARFVARPTFADNPDSMIFFKYCHVLDGFRGWKRAALSWCVPVGRWGPKSVATRFGGLVRNVKPHWIVFSFLPVLQTNAIAFVAALPIEDPAMCSSQFIAVIVIVAVLAAAMLVARPYRIAMLHVARTVTSVCLIVVTAMAIVLAGAPTLDRRATALSVSGVAFVVMTVASVALIAVLTAVKVADKLLWGSDGREHIWLDGAGMAAFTPADVDDNQVELLTNASFFAAFDVAVSPPRGPSNASFRRSPTSGKSSFSGPATSPPANRSRNASFRSPPGGSSFAGPATAPQ